MKKTLTFVALLSLVTVSAIAEEIPMMTQTNNQGESTRIQQQVERQNMQANRYENKSGTQNASGSQVQTRTQTQTRTQMQTMQMQGIQMQPQMQHNSRMGGGRSR